MKGSWFDGVYPFGRLRAGSEFIERLTMKEKEEAKRIQNDRSGN